MQRDRGSRQHGGVYRVEDEANLPHEDNSNQTLPSMYEDEGTSHIVP